MSSIEKAKPPMKKPILLICTGLLTVLAAAPAQADWWPFGWSSREEEWQDYKKHNPYLETGKDTQNQQWVGEDWYAQDWFSQKDPQKLIDGFFQSDIFRKREQNKGATVLVVGPQFYRLGGFDKRRVVTTFDAAYGITSKAANPVIILRDWYTDRDIGLFTKDGLQLE